MPKDERLDLLRELEKVRGSRVISYVTADRGLASVPVGDDVVRKIYRQLRTIGKVPRLDLFIASRGGDSQVPWPLVKAFRRFTDTFTVLIPYRSHSAATMIATGADELIFGRIGELTQVDPSVRSEFTPTGSQPGQTMLVSAQDLNAYFEFMQDKSEQGADTTVTADLLREKVHPLAIGQVHRARQSAQEVTERLLKLHMKDASKAKAIAQALMTQLHVHAHKISLEEAQELDLPARAASDEEDNAMWALYESYEQELLLEEPLRVTNIFPNPTVNFVELKDQKMAYVESTVRTEFYVMDFVVSRTPAQSTGNITFPAGQPGNQPIQPIPQRPLWNPQVSFGIERECWSTE